MIFDFIRSWLYYPKLIKWLNDNNYGSFKDRRFQYAIKHCRMKKGIKKLNKKMDDYTFVWKCQYQQEPITKNITD